MPKKRIILPGLALLAFVVPAPAGAQPTLTLGFSGGADPFLATGDSTVDAPWIARAVSEGAKVIRVDVHWASIAPATRPAGFADSNPASRGYNWTRLDAAVRELSQAGLEPLLDVWSAPTWAEGPGIPRGFTPGAWRPSAPAFGAFASAIATRYSGAFPDPLRPGACLPRVALWEAWNEPNLSIYLGPQWLRTVSGWQAQSPVLYRNLANAFYAAVKAVNRSNLVLGGGTAPYGDAPGGQRMQPVTFVRAEFCLNADLRPLPCRSPIHINVLDHHPYGIGGPLWHALNADDVAVPDLYKLTAILRAAERARTVLPAGRRQVWVTEESWSTKPPNPHAVPIMTAARWLEQSFYVLWRQGVRTILWWQIADSPPIPNYADTYQAGVYFLDGHPKPGAVAFRFPFVTMRLDPGHVLAWGRAPARGVALLEVAGPHGWRVLDRLSVQPGGVFEARLALAGHADLRVQLGHETSLVWIQQA